MFQTLSFSHCIASHQNFAGLGISMLLIEASFYLFIYRPLSFRHCLCPVEKSFFINGPFIVLLTLSFSHCIALHQNFAALGISMLLIEASFYIQTIVFQTLSFSHCVCLFVINLSKSSQSISLLYQFSCHKSTTQLI